jgi:hypothetical protein
MRAKEFLIETQVLDEIDMSPSSLKQLAANTGAMAGMEFEMYVPDVADDNDEDLTPERNYEEDIPARSIDQIYEFFRNDDWNTERDLEKLVNILQEQYYEWIGEKIERKWRHAPLENVYNWAKENIEYDDRDDLEEKVEKAVEEGYGNDIYEQAYEAFREDMLNKYMNDDASERKFLLDSDLRFMSDVEIKYDIEWPHWTYPEEEGKRTIKQVALQFMNDIGINTIAVADSYHGNYFKSGGDDNWRSIGRNKPYDTYTIEPDGSLDSKKNSSDAGLEFVSNPMPIDEMITSLNDVVKWAKANDCYTNKSTGLHMNVSVPGCNRERLDYVKLALLLGDEYVLNQFGRIANPFAKSAMSNLKSKAAYMSSEPELLDFFDQMRRGLSAEASKIIHSGNTSKYVSINTKDGYIEFRSPGGDWLNEDIPKLENTLLRFVVALDAACDPEKYRNEYLKKLYKLLKPTARDYANRDPLDLFADYAAGKLNKKELKQILQILQRRRRDKDKPLEPIKAKVSAGPAEPAFGRPPSNTTPRMTEYQIYDNRTGEEIELFQAQDDEAALIRLDDYRRWARNSEMSIDPNTFVIRRL